MIKWLECNSEGIIFFNVADNEQAYLDYVTKDNFLGFIDEKLPITPDQAEMYKMLRPELSSAWGNKSFIWVTEKDIEWEKAMDEYAVGAAYSYRVLTPGGGLTRWY